MDEIPNSCGDFRFSMENGCVVLEIFGNDDDEEEEVEDDEDEDGDSIGEMKLEDIKKEEIQHEIEEFNCSYKSVAKDEFNDIDKIYEVVKTENKKEPDECSDNEEYENYDLDLELEVTEEKNDNLLVESFHAEIENDIDTQVISIKPEAEAEVLTLDSNSETSFDGFNFSGKTVNTNNGITVNAHDKQALSLNELYQHYSQGTSTRSDREALQTAYGRKKPEHFYDDDTENDSEDSVIIEDFSESKRKGFKSFHKDKGINDLKRALLNADLRRRHINSSFRDDASDQSQCQKLQCDICKKWYSGIQSLSVHMRIHNNVKPYKCSVCGWQSRTSSAHNMHVKTHSQDKQYRCGVCNMEFYTSSSLNAHFRVHSGERPFKCTYCSDRFAHQSTLRIHVRQHTREKPYKCTICAKAFTQQTHLATHLRMHNQIKPYQCNYCGKRMTQSSHLKIHLRIHTQERPYNCAECSANFMTKEHLVMHMRTHSGDTPYKCRICGQGFTQSSARKTHERRHEGVSEYKCRVCECDCISERALKQHMAKTHGPISPLQCDICLQSFARKPHVKRHKKEVHYGVKRNYGENSKYRPRTRY